MRTDGKCFYNVKVTFNIEDDKGKVKKVTEQYLALAVSVTDAEVIVTQEFSQSMSDFKVVSVQETKIIDVLTAKGKKTE